MGCRIVCPKGEPHAEQEDDQQCERGCIGNRNQEGDEQQHFANEKRFASKPVCQPTKQGRAEQNAGQRCRADKTVTNAIKTKFPGNER